MSKVLIVGGGAAGMASALWLAEKGFTVHLFEQNEKLGKKLFITGKGRCNFTNDCEMEKLFSSVVSNPKFLYSSFYGFTNQQTIELFEGLGVRTKVERGGRAFPLSDHSSDIIRALERKLQELDVKIHLKSKIQDLLIEDGKARGLLLQNGAKIAGDAVIVATGGLSYQSTGSLGDGYRFAEHAGHMLVTPRPALVPLETEEEYIWSMQGLSLKNVTLSVMDGKKCKYTEFGEMLFTHFGISGPLALTASSYIGKLLEKKSLKAYIDLKPALTEEQLSNRLLREFDQGKNKQFKNIIPSFLPAKMLPVALAIGGISGDTPVHEITKEMRMGFVKLLKAFPFTITKTRDYNEAIITQGGVSIKQINPSTMESKLVEGLYFIGEVLDLDAVTGGFNLQIAWSTAYTAAEAIQVKE